MRLSLRRNEVVITPKWHRHSAVETSSFSRRDIVILPRRHCHSAAETSSFCRRERVRTERTSCQDYPDSKWERSIGMETRLNRCYFLLNCCFFIVMRKCPSLPPVTPLKALCTKGWEHGRDIRSPSRLPPVFRGSPSPRPFDGDRRRRDVEWGVSEEWV